MRINTRYLGFNDAVVPPLSLPGRIIDVVATPINTLFGWEGMDQLNGAFIAGAILVVGTSYVGYQVIKRIRR